MTSGERGADMTSFALVHLLVVAIIPARNLVACCSFPDTLQVNTRDPPWYSHVRTDGSRDAEYYIRHNVMEIHYPRSDRPNVRWKCTMSFHDKLLLKRQDHLINNYYRCVQFKVRSRSIMQIMWSHEVKTFDLGLCDDLNLNLDPWPLIWYGTLEDDYIPCPFTGGFDMKIVDSQLGENGCNLMLRPMRMEVECLGGEGVTFNFMSSNCLPAIKMYVKQRTICVTNWQDSKNHYVILRRTEDIDLWCLVIPINRSSNVTAYLFSDLACVSDTDKLPSMTDIRFFTLYLHTRVFSTLCEDEYDQCSKVTCNTYVKQECQKSCGVCDNTSRPRECEFPPGFVGSWFLKDANGYNEVDIGRSNITITEVGNFVCVSYPNRQAYTSSLYTSISLYQNGCRPRFTCLKFNKAGPSVLQFSLSQSYIWPTLENDLGSAICSEDRFHPDPSPIDDRYRPHEGASKPIIAHKPKAEPVMCNLTTVHTISATLPKGYICSGSLYRHCEDSTMIRLGFQSCGNLIPASTDYRCLANFEGHYWERILLVQNVQDEMDVICFVFSQFYPNEAYVLVSSQCDQKSFSFARSGLRQPMLKLATQFQPEPCKSVPKILPTTKPTELPFGTSKSDISMREEHGDANALTNMTSDESNYYSPVFIVETGSPSGKTGSAPQKGTYLDTKSGHEIPSAKSTSFRDDSLSGAADSGARSLTSTYAWILICVVKFVLCR